ncbi:MAG: hypothetical protein R6W73_00370 [Candidatus Saliniplasma sp.]
MIEKKERIISLIKKKLGSSPQEIVHKKWVHDIYDILLEDGRRVILKTVPEGDFVNEIVITDFMLKNDLPVPKVLDHDPTCTDFPEPYMIKEWVGGNKLGKVLKSVNETEALKIFRTVGRVFGRMNELHNERSGLIRDEPYNTLPVSPNEYMFNAEIANGSGKKAVEDNWISESLHQRIIHLWEENMGYLKDHRSSLIHFSPFHWTIYLDKVEGKWQVTKLTAVGDVLWWDAACNVAFFKYPPFLEMKESWWNAFVDGYGDIPDKRRIDLYLLLIIISAGAGTYMEPVEDGNDSWRRKAFAKLEEIVDEWIS